MKRLHARWYAIACLVVCASVAACGAQATQHLSDGQNGPTGHPELYVVDGGGAANTSPQAIVGFHPGGDPATAIRMPAGLASQDHRVLYAATAHAGVTTVAVINTRTGVTLRSLVVVGTYSTAGWGYGNATMTRDGRWLALRDLDARDTSIALVDTQMGALASTIHLNGHFTLDAISPHGTMLYLLQDLGDAQHHYYVRAYDMQARHLLDTIIVDKTALDETQMHGTALTRQSSSDGSVDYTLYINPATNDAFIHALPLADSANGPLFAHCIDLPVGTASNLLRYYTLTMSADGATLYAVNTALGLMARVNIAGGGAAIYSDQVIAQEHFNPSVVATSSAYASASAQPLYDGAALAPDQRTMYSVGVRGIWALDTLTLRPSATYLSQDTFSDVALSADGKTLFGVERLRGIVSVHLANGQASATSGCPARDPWGIAWIAP